MALKQPQDIAVKWETPRLVSKLVCSRYWPSLRRRTFPCQTLIQVILFSNGTLSLLSATFCQPLSISQLLHYAKPAHWFNLWPAASVIIKHLFAMTVACSYIKIFWTFTEAWFRDELDLFFQDFTKSVFNLLVVKLKLNQYWRCNAPQNSRWTTVR